MVQFLGHFFDELISVEIVPGFLKYNIFLQGHNLSVVLISPLPSFHIKYTWCHLIIFIGLAVPHMRLYLIIITMPLKRCVATENDLPALLQNEALTNI